MADRGSWGLILALWAAGLGAAAQYGKLAVIYDLLPALYPGEAVRLGWAVSLVGAVGIALGVVAGLLVARIGYRRALLGGLWLGAAVSAVQALAPPLGWLMASRVVEGASHLAIVVAAPTLIAAVATDRQRPVALTLWGTFFGVAFALIALAGRPLAVSWGVPALFAAHAAVMALLALLLAPRLEPLGHDRPEAPGLAELARVHARLYRSPRLAAAGLGWLFYTFCFVSLLTVLPPLLPPGSAAAVQTFAPLAAILISMTLGVALLQRASAVTVTQLGFGLSALAAVWLLLQPGAAPAIAIIGLMGLVQGASFAVVPELNASDADRALGNGAMAQMGNLGNTLGTPVIAAIYLGAGYGAMVGAVAAMLALGAGTHLWLAARR